MKVWGWELWITNSKLYCGKILHLLKNYCCSYHYHKVKDETFYILKGSVRMNIEGSVTNMLPGKSIHIKPGTKHQFLGLEESEILEISTQHFDSDSYRLSKSRKL